MEDKDIIDFAMEFRSGILEDKRSSYGMCFAICAPLSTLLILSNVNCEMVESSHEDIEESNFLSHCWIKLDDGRVLDPTYDQFNEENGDPIYLGPPTKFHE